MGGGQCTGWPEERPLRSKKKLAVQARGVHWGATETGNMHGSRWKRVIGVGIVAGTAAVAACSGGDRDDTSSGGVFATGLTEDPETGSGPMENDGNSSPGPGTVGGDDQAAQGCAEIGAIEEDGRICFYDADDPQAVVASIQHVLGTRTEGEVLYLRLTLDRQFVDNTYGENAVGWASDGMQDKKGKGGHTFKDLVGSDKGGLELKDEDGNVLLDFEIDYLSADDDAPSGYASLGVWGGDGKVLEGPAEAVVAATSSLDRNLNERGYGQYTTDSPATDAEYTPHPDAPEWDFDVVYEAWVTTDAFVDRPVHHACIDAIHASPSKGEGHTLTVIPGPCDGCPGGDCGSGGDSGSDTSGGDAHETSDSGDTMCEFDPDIGCDQGSVPQVP